ncbi:MAG: ATP-binding protein, partial [Rhodocyclaceae bacterium]|nr:ATP-binding protein [Rhodocyclaceae bacterium]
LSKAFPVILLTGPRQVGKTTMLQYLGRKEFPRRNYISLDEFAPRNLANSDPELFLERYKPPLIIDEIQYAPALLQRLKVLVDRSKKNGQYWLTGSQHFTLMEGVSESLAGRVAIIKLLGLSQSEEYRTTDTGKTFRPDRIMPPSKKVLAGIEAFFRRIVRGTFPRFIHKDAPPIQAFHGSYLQTYIERDVRSILNIVNLSAFEKFLRLAAARAGQLLNLSDLARDAQIAVSTAKEWIGILEASFQVYLLRPYFQNISKRQIKTPKIYFLDTGLVCYLTGWHNAEVASRGAMAGSLLENYVISEAIRNYWHRGLEAPLYFWRTKEKEEVDLIIEEEGTIFPVEIKLTMRPDKNAVKGIISLKKSGRKIGKGAVVCLAEEHYPLSSDIEVVPVSYI